MKKYIVVSDFVKSKSDGDVHFISNSKLVDLYKVRHEDCEFTTAERFHFDTLGMDLDKLIILRPRFDGNYTIPKNNDTPLESPKDSNVPEWAEKVREALHIVIPHTPLKFSETNGTPYDNGYIFYQDLVLSNIPETEQELFKVIRTLIASETAKERVKVIESVNGLLDHYTVKCIESRRIADISRKQFMELLDDRTNP